MPTFVSDFGRFSQRLTGWPLTLVTDMATTIRNPIYTTRRDSIRGERSCSQMCSQTADSADVRECSLASKSLVALRIRSLANCGELRPRTGGQGAAGSNPVIPTENSRSEAVSDKIRGGLFAAVYPLV
jgi:hypothetical protein